MYTVNMEYLSSNDTWEYSSMDHIIAIQQN